ncbi:hypothetical protein B7R22_17115 [Subtercola boreus]|uniref:Large polyvalent protein associated domain-containing protein n=1 Tax=Subtercola boreus TaxID=120213 RepID=A0A3E0VRG1_9MICO|nr:LPD29 domain-containing protein [Subtercola boreus]RFA12150.1 hypothetical protein B7R22_17115 [Subtercola boreus]
MDTTYDTPVTIAAEARKAIRAAFPGLKFSLTGTRGTGYGWLRLSWTDGPTDKQMREVTQPFDVKLGGHAHINASRKVSPAAERWARDQIAAHPGRWDQPHDFGGDYYAVQACLAVADLTEVAL